MKIHSKEVYIILIIQVIELNKKLSIRKTVQLYYIPRTILSNRIRSKFNLIKNQSKSYNLIELKEKVFIQYIFDIDLKDILSKFKNVENITNYIFKLKNTKYIEKL